MSGLLIEDKRVIKLFGNYKKFLIDLSMMFEEYNNSIAEAIEVGDEIINERDPIRKDELGYKANNLINRADYYVHKLVHSCLSNMLLLKDDQLEIKQMCNELEDYLTNLKLRPPSRMYI